jgi:PPOX class probable F420-dependent enzyme
MHAWCGRGPVVRNDGDPTDSANRGRRRVDAARRRWYVPGAEVTPMATSTIPEQFKDLLSNNQAFAHLATVMPDGSPQVTPVWFDYSDGKLRVNTARGRIKDRNMHKNSKVALSIIDPANPYRHLAIRGHIAAETEQGADAHIDSLAKKYLGKDKYPFAKPGEQRVIFEIEPDSVSAMG